MQFAVLVQKLLPFVTSAESHALKRDLDGIIAALTLKGTTTEYCGLANISEQRIEKDADFHLVKRIIRLRLVVDELTTNGWKSDCGGIDDCITECDELLRDVGTSAFDVETRKATLACEKHRPKARGGDDGACWYVTASDEATLEQLLGIAKSTLLAVPPAAYQKDADAVLAARIGMQNVLDMFGKETDENSTKLLSELRTLETQLWLSHCEDLLAFLFAQKQLDRKRIAMTAFCRQQPSNDFTKDISHTLRSGRLPQGVQPDCCARLKHR